MSRQVQEKVKARSGQVDGKVKERFRQGKSKVKERSRQAREARIRKEKTLLISIVSKPIKL